MKKILFIPLVIFVLLGFTSCKFLDSLFYVAPDVSVSDLHDYTGSLPTTKDGVMTAAGSGAYYTLYCVYYYMSTSDEFTDAFSSVYARAFSRIPTMNLLKSLLQKRGMKKITAEQTGFDDDSLEKEASIKITDEDIDVEDLGGDSGTITINSISGEIKATVSDNEAPFTVTLEKAEADVDIDGTDIDVGTGAVVNTAKIGLKAKASGTVKIGSDYTPTSIVYDLSISIKAGFSVSAGTRSSGKFIIEISYYDSGNLSAADLESSEFYGLDNVDMEMTIKMYDNKDALLDTYELTEDDLVEMIEAGL